jgi:hypothetical protein
MIKHRSLAKEAEATTSNCIKQEEQMISAKTALMEQALVNGVVEPAKEQLNLLKEFKSLFDNIQCKAMPHWSTTRQHMIFLCNCHA